MIALYILGLVVTFWLGLKCGDYNESNYAIDEIIRDQRALTTKDRESVYAYQLPTLVFRKGAHIRKMLKDFEIDNGIEVHSSYIPNMLELINEAEELIKAGDQTIDPVLLQEFKEKLMTIEVSQ